MIELLKRQTQRIHELVALPALGYARSLHALTQGLRVIFRNLRIHGDGNVRNPATEQPLADPLAAMDGVILHVAGVGHKPGALRQHAHALGRHPVGMLLQECRQIMLLFCQKSRQVGLLFFITLLFGVRHTLFQVRDSFFQPRFFAIEPRFHCRLGVTPVVCLDGQQTREDLAVLV